MARDKKCVDPLKYVCAKFLKEKPFVKENILGGSALRLVREEHVGLNFKLDT